jgi:putative CocE/NonD family hydrolase
MIVEKNTLVKMKDGVEIALDVYRPETGDARYPAILIYVPYHKDDFAILRSYPDYPDYFTSHGYAVAIADVRGTGSSGGGIYRWFGPEEEDDGVEIVEWIARQGWCDGSVGMTGISYPGINSVLVATHRPPHLKAIVPIYGVTDNYELFYPGGNMRILSPGYITTFRLGLDAYPPGYRDPDGRWMKVWREHLEKNKPIMLSELEHQTYDEYQRRGSMMGRAKQIDAATFVVAGWHDVFPTEPFHLYSSLRPEVPKKILMGPWTHTRPDIGVPGPRIDYLREVLRWFDQWLKGVDSGVKAEPPVTLFVRRYDRPVRKRDMESGDWRHENEWPIARRVETPFYLRDGGALDTSPPGPDERGSDEYEYDPTVGTASRWWNAMGWDTNLPLDQRIDEMFSLCYTTGALEREIEVSGDPIAILHVSSSAEVASFSVNLSDVAPDGTSAQATRGIANATHRNSDETPEPLVPGETCEIKVPLDTLAYVFEKGHRIRVAVSSANLPETWPTANRAVNCVHRSANLPSRVVLPVVPPQEPPIPKPRFLPPRSGIPNPNAGSALTKWEVARDSISSSVTVTTSPEGWLKLADDAETSFKSEMRIRVSSKNPADASAKAYYYSTVRQGTTKTVVDADTLITSDAASFQYTASLRITVNDLPFWNKNWAATFKRNLL